MAAQLRLYQGSLETSPDDSPEPSVRVSLRDMLPLIAMAKRHNYLWLDDFLEDEVTITPDLYEVLRAFSDVHRPSA
jgi:hypothetical protein